MSDPINMKNDGVNMLLQQVAALFQQGNLVEAEKAALKLLEFSPKHIGATQLLGGIKASLGEYQSAFDLFSTVVELNPNLPGNFNNLGYVLHMMGRLDEARSACLRAIQLNPDFAEAHNTLAVILKDLGHMDEAFNAIQRAIQIRSDFVEAHNTLVVILMDMGRFHDALPVCQRMIQLRPDFAEAYNLLAIVLHQLGRLEEALVACDQSIKLRANFSVFYNTRGNLLNEQSRMQDALDAYSQAIEINPELADSYYNRGNVLGNLGRFVEAEADYSKAMMLDPQHADAHSNLLFVHASAACLPHHEMLEQQKQWDNVHGEQGRLNAISIEPIKKKEGEIIRVGYVSADFCMHPVSYFFEPLLAAHDRNKFEIFCYANMFELQADSVTNRLRDLADHWRFVKNKSDTELANLIRQDEIDILIDLSGHTRGNRLKVFTYRPAPIQATYLGYCASSGLQAMDYWITDDVLHPLDTAELSTETIIRLPRCSFCYQPPQEANIHVSRIDGDNGIVFASYSHLSKLQPVVIDVWSKILKNVAGSRLLIMNKYMADVAARSKLVDQFKLHDIGEDRLIIKIHLSYEDYYKSYSEVDIVLDPFPRTGGTTTADALWMGVPVVTLEGNNYVERISASKLHAVGLDELIAYGQNEYVEIASRIAGDEAYLHSLRENLRDRMVSSSLCDADGLAKAMEKVYRKMCFRSYV